MTEVPGDYLQARQTEAEFIGAVIEMARLLGWRVHHGRPGRTVKGWRTPIQGDMGFPDLVLVRGGRLLFVELKTERGRLSEGQKDWLQALGGCVGRAHLWRPRDWVEIEKALR